MNRGLLILCFFGSVWLAYAQAENPIRATITEDTTNRGTQIVLENGSTVALTAVTFTSATQRFPPGIDSAVRIGGQDLKPGKKLRMTFAGDYQAARMGLGAAVLADGRTFGDPALIEAILARRRATLEALGIVLQHLPANAPVGPVLPLFRSYKAEQVSGVHDGAVLTAIANVNLFIERTVQTMTGELPGAIVMDITTMLRNWQTELDRSLPSLIASH